MFDDQAIARSADAAVRSIAAPPLPLESILHKMGVAQQTPAPGRVAFVRAAVAAAAILGILGGAYPAQSVAVIQSLQARYRAALETLGGTAPPPPPRTLVKTLQAQARRVTVSQARAGVPFTLVVPEGLPHDVTRAQIELIGTGVYDRAANRWSKDGNAVTFVYTRTGGRHFALLADKYDPHMTLPGKYMFEAKDPGRDGRPVLVRHEHFAWRNGDQITSASAGDGISANDILAIQRAMRGIALALRDLHARQAGSRSKVYVAP